MRRPEPRHGDYESILDVAASLRSNNRARRASEGSSEQETWAKRIERFAESELTAREYASELGISESALKWWKWKLTSPVALSREARSVLDETPISNGIRYARNQREGLSRFLDDGRLPIHNNMSELALRREAIGRKNWLFVGSDDGGAVNATFTSLLASCSMHDVEPWSYLRDVFCLLAHVPEHRLLELAPLNWKRTLERPEVQKLLAADRFRQLTLDTKA